MIESYTVGLVATVPALFNAQGAYFRLIDGTNVDVSFYRRGAVVGSARGMNAGFFARAKDGEVFDAVELVSATAQTAKLLIGSAESGAASAVTVSGTVPVVLPVVPFTQTNPAVGIASGLLVAANAARKFLMVQNLSVSQDVVLNLAGGAAVLASGVKLAPGASLLLDVATPSGAINAIASAAGAVVVVVEG